jgi:hypothetical protein
MFRPYAIARLPDGDASKERRGNKSIGVMGWVRLCTHGFGKPRATTHTFFRTQSAGPQDRRGDPLTAKLGGNVQVRHATILDHGDAPMWTDLTAYTCRVASCKPTTEMCFCTLADKKLPGEVFDIASAMARRVAAMDGGPQKTSGRSF